MLQAPCWRQPAVLRHSPEAALLLLLLRGRALQLALLPTAALRAAWPQVPQQRGPRQGLQALRPEPQPERQVLPVRRPVQERGRR